MRTRIVLLNGVGSSGKSAIARALQTLSVDVLLHVQMDAFLEMLPERMLDDRDGFVFEPVRGDDGRPAVQISSGPAGERLMTGMRLAVRAMADAGNHLVVDDVTFAEQVGEYRQLLTDHDLVVVAVMAPLDVLEERERDRGDRMIGLARWQYDRVHSGIDYDLTLDTEASSAVECAQVIIEYIESSAP